MIVGNPHKDFTEDEMKKEIDKNYNIYTNDDLRLVVAHCMYNEEQNLERCLNNDLEIIDLDAIHILDGAWENSGAKSPISTDRSFEIIEEFRKKTDIPIILEHYPEKSWWKSEGEKRNHQLKLIQKMFDGTKTYAFIKDCDEVLMANTGRQTFWIKGSFANWYPDIGLLTTYGYNSSIGGDGARFIPLGFDIHYYTEKTMVIHDKDHNILVDYNGDNGNRQITVNQGKHQIFNFNSYRLINNWNIRNKNRMREKSIFDNFRVKQFNNSGNCKY